MPVEGQKRMRRMAFVTLSCLVLTTGCAAPLGMAAASLAGGAATEAASELGHEASTRLGLWLNGDDAAPPPPEACGDDPDADGCEPERLLAAYLTRASPERREQVLAALPPDLRERMVATLLGEGTTVATPTSLFIPFATAVP